MTLTEPICLALRHLRFLSGKTQDEVYFETGIRVSNYETKRRQPTISNLNILCNFYRIEIESFLELVKASVSTKVPIESLINVFFENRIKL